MKPNVTSRSGNEREPAPIPDNDVENDEVFTVSMPTVTPPAGITVNASDTATGTINDNDNGRLRQIRMIPQFARCKDHRQALA